MLGRVYKWSSAPDGVDGKERSLTGVKLLALICRWVSQ